MLTMGPGAQSSAGSGKQQPAAREEMSSPTVASDTPALDLREADGALHIHFNRTQMMPQRSTRCTTPSRTSRRPRASRPRSSTFGRQVRTSSRSRSALLDRGVGCFDGLRAFSRLEKSLSSLERMNKPAAVVLDGPTGPSASSSRWCPTFDSPRRPSSSCGDAARRSGMSVFRLAATSGSEPRSRPSCSAIPSPRTWRCATGSSTRWSAGPEQGAVDDTDESLRNGLKYLVAPADGADARAPDAARGRNDGLPQGLQAQGCSSTRSISWKKRAVRGE